MKNETNEDALWEHLNLSKIVRAFQQHNLREDLTAIKCQQSRWNQTNPSMNCLVTLSEKMCGTVTKYVSLRMSRRVREKLGTSNPASTGSGEMLR